MLAHMIWDILYITYMSHILRCTFQQPDSYEHCLILVEDYRLGFFNAIVSALKFTKILANFDY